MSLHSKIRGFGRALRNERIFFLAPLTLSIIIIAAAGAYYFEREGDSSSINSIWDGVWWAFVTICTVGYGDKVPASDGGKVIGIFLMVSGIGLLSMLTAAVASVLVEQKMKEGKGLESITEKEHVVICGWNDHTEEVIRGLTAENSPLDALIVTINELSIDEIDALKTKYEKHNVRFLRGDYVHEEVLLRANIGKAVFALIMADLSGNHARERADDRTILAALAMKSLAPKIKVVAEIMDGENRSHLVRANVDEIIVRGEHVGSLLASAVKSPGLSRVVSDLLSLEGAGTLMRHEIPRLYIGRGYEELSDYFRSKHRAILIGVLRETKGVRVEDLLTDDASAIDTFIKEKLKESKKDVFHKEDAVKVVINPDRNYVIGRDDYAVLIGPSGFGRS